MLKNSASREHPIEKVLIFAPDKISIMLCPCEKFWQIEGRTKEMMFNLVGIYGVSGIIACQMHITYPSEREALFFVSFPAGLPDPFTDDSRRASFALFSFSPS